MKSLQKVVLVLVGIMLVSFGLAALLGLTLPGGSIVSTTIDSQEVYTAVDVEGIFVETISTDMNFIPVEGDEIRVHFHGIARGSLGSIPELRTVKTGNNLRIMIEHKPFVNIGFMSTRNVKLDIYIPRSFGGEIVANSVSGDVDIRELDLQKFRFKAVSGKLQAEVFTAERAVLESVSGNIRVEDFRGDVQVDVVSGNVFLGFKEFANDVSIKSTSGDARLELPADAEFEISLRTVSGKVNTGFPISLDGDNRNMYGTVGAGQHRIIMSSVSGNVEIKPVR
jgi:lia operon protein LiaG